MRKILIAIVILLLLVLATPYFMGMLAQTKIEQINATVNSFAPVKVQISDYKRGWFRSTAKATITLKHSKLVASTPNSQFATAISTNPELAQINVTAQITHGPVAFKDGKFKLVQGLINANLELTPAQTALLQQSKNNFATVELQISLGGCSEIKVNGAPFAYQNKERHFQWQGMQLNISLSRMLDKLVYDMNLPGLDLTIPNLEMHLAGFKSYFNGVKDPEEFWIGEHKINLQAFNLKYAAQPNIGITNLQLNLKTVTEKNTINLQFAETVDNLDLGGTKYQKNRLNFNANGLNKKIFAKLNRHFEQNYFNWHQKMQLLNTMVELLNSGGTFNLQELQTLTPWGQLGLKLNLVTMLQSNGNSILALLANSTLNVEINAEQKLVLQLLEQFFRSKNPPVADPQKEAATTLAAWQNSGKLKTKDKDLLFNIEYKNNALTFNGKPTLLGK